MSEPINLDEIDDLSESEEGPKRDVRQRTTAGPIDLDEIDDLDALQPKRKKPRKDDRKKGTPQAPQDDMHLRKIERRRKKILGERSPSPGRLDRERQQQRQEHGGDDINAIFDGDHFFKEDEFPDPLPDLVGAKGDRPMTKIEQQLEKARLQKEKARKQAVADEKINKKKLGARRREFDMMRSTVTHWSDKKLDQMTERDWRIFNEDFEIQVIGTGFACPNPMRNWEEGYKMGLLPPKVMQAIRECRYKFPSPVQMACIPVGIRRLDLIGLAETGSGKTCAFVVPMVVYISEQAPLTAANIDSGPYALIMCPTRELARQIELECRAFCKPYGFKTVSVVGGTSFEDQGAEIRRGAELIVGTPGRLCDLLNRHYLVLPQCNYVILDEADSMVKEGMEEQVVQVFDQMPSSNVKPVEADEEDATKTYRVTVMFSSTMAAEIEGIAKRHLRRPVVIKIGVSSPSDIKQTVVVLEEPGDKRGRYLQLLQEAIASCADPLIITFCNHKPETESIASLLDSEKIPAEFMHGGLTQVQRERVIENFHERKFLVLVATDVIGRGIDIKGVTHVFNYDVPAGDGAIDKYSQRIGRTGRAGMKGEAVSLMLKTDTDIMYALKKKLESEGQVVPSKLAAQEAARVAPGKLENRRRRDTVLFARGV